ncbi:PfkB family carbohydrate kinase [Microbacterium sp. BWT-B31]|uniref:PfkB family carbohydrate kinase n=1 Tax=Microbacterium sp. BWT-B31 TaxID=3232072 RepID=UPI003527393D
MTGRVVVIGDALIDEIRADTGVHEFVGGAALNVAVGLSRLGVPTALIAMVGDDAAGAHIRSYLETFGVELLASPSPLGSSRAVSVRSGGGEPEYTFNDAAQQRRVRFGARERAAIADAPFVVVSCFPFDDVAQTGALADAVAGARLAIDPNPRTGMMHDLDEFRRGFERLAAGASVVKVGEDDAALLYGEPLDALRARLIDAGVDVVLATQGAAGATLEAGGTPTPSRDDPDASREDSRRAGTAVTRPVSKLSGSIVDTMGAGDAAFAATVAALVEATPADADEWGAVLQSAMDVAAATCRFEGALLRLPSALVGPDLDRLGT